MLLYIFLIENVYYWDPISAVDLTGFLNWLLHKDCFICVKTFIKVIFQFTSPLTLRIFPDRSELHKQNTKMIKETDLCLRLFVVSSVKIFWWCVDNLERKTPNPDTQISSFHQHAWLKSKTYYSLVDSTHTVRRASRALVWRKYVRGHANEQIRFFNASFPWI